MTKANLPEATLEDVAKLRCEFELASKQGADTRDAMIRLIWASVHSKQRRHLQEGITMAKQLLTLEKSEEQQLNYLIAVGEYNLGNLSASRKRLKIVLQKWPEFRQAVTLTNAIEDQMTSDALFAGGAVAALGGVAAVAVAALLARK